MWIAISDKEWINSDYIVWIIKELPNNFRKDPKKLHSPYFRYKAALSDGSKVIIFSTKDANEAHNFELNILGLPELLKKAYPD